MEKSEKTAGWIGPSDKEETTGFCLKEQAYFVEEFDFADAQEDQGFDLSVDEDGLDFSSLPAATAASSSTKVQPDGFSIGLDDVEHEGTEELEWKPGLNVGAFVRRRWAPVTSQSCVLLTNLTLNLKKVPSHILRDLVAHLPAFPACSLSSAPFRAASCLVRLAEGTLRGIYQKLST